MAVGDSQCVEPSGLTERSDGFGEIGGRAACSAGVERDQVAGRMVDVGVEVRSHHVLCGYGGRPEASGSQENSAALGGVAQAGRYSLDSPWATATGRRRECVGKRIKRRCLSMVRPWLPRCHSAWRHDGERAVQSPPSQRQLSGPDANRAGSASVGHGGGWRSTGPNQIAPSSISTPHWRRRLSSLTSSRDIRTTTRIRFSLVNNAGAARESSRISDGDRIGLPGISGL